MLGTIFEIIFGFLGEFLFQFIAEVVMEKLYETFRHAFKPHKEASKKRALIGYFMLGGCLGVLSFWLYPKRIIPIQGIPGLSMLIVPLLVGSAMSRWGKYQTRKGATISNLATFDGGVSFAFGISLIRFLIFLQAA